MSNSAALAISIITRVLEIHRRSTGITYLIIVNSHSIGRISGSKGPTSQAECPLTSPTRSCLTIPSAKASLTRVSKCPIAQWRTRCRASPRKNRIWTMIGRTEILFNKCLPTTQSIITITGPTYRTNKIMAMFSSNNRSNRSNSRFSKWEAVAFQGKSRPKSKPHIWCNNRLNGKACSKCRFMARLHPSTTPIDTKLACKLRVNMIQAA